ncbi:asparagine synthetase B family protein [Aliikangiella coralliicola]|uniref:asparagine synthase (glutamine-hydrolyzing) n=1 Tax=Aliikangiella coralliicola TaxID=2592383 RepID=A0A545U7A9_9GAMM|nr:asparagine synthase-related protein [Aliikangiella coralliicola]TQV85352.1 hypothetical protein FLL46_19490 [Aliikangiella coralliicola]
MSTIHACRLNKERCASQILSKMLKASDYWHPDERSKWVSSETDVGLAKAHLLNTERSIDDASYFSSELGVAICANARVDNRSVLLKQLSFSEEDSRIKTDAQLIAHCYKKWQVDCPARLRGDFVFIIWDEEKQKFFCARDHFGVKSLFYSRNERGVMITNEHNAFFTSEWFNRYQYDEPWLIARLWNLGALDFESPNSEIQALPPAHSLEIDEKGTRLQRYWRLTSKTTWKNYSDNELIEELKLRFEKSVIARLDSRYPLGAELSAGLDSNGIVGYAAQHLKKQSLYTFSHQCEALTKENYFVWGDVYRDIQTTFKLHENIEPVWDYSPKTECLASDTSEQLLQSKKKFYRCFGGVVPIYGGHFVRSKLAKKNGVRVMLSGWGGDHCVTGYGDEFADELFRNRKFISIFRLLKAKRLRGRGGNIIRSFIILAIKQFLPSLYLKMKGLRSGVENSLLFRAKNHFLGQKWKTQYELENTLVKFLNNYQCHSVNRKESLELFELSLTNRLTESELEGRLFKVEYRYPMLDVDLVEFFYSLPSQLKIYDGIERYPFRLTLEGLVPEHIRWRKKHDVCLPQKDKKAEIERKLERLIPRLEYSLLVERYSSVNALQKCISSKSRALLDSLEFLMDVEEYYYSGNEQKKPLENPNEKKETITALC